VLLFFACLVAESFAFTYVYLRNKGSLIFAVLLHMAFNASANINEALFPSLKVATTATRESIYVTQFLLVGAWTLGCFFLDPAVRKAVRYSGNEPRLRG
jgi:membrane protease YdiL (CAAX protease family)